MPSQSKPSITLDLHGVRHQEVAEKVENFVFIHQDQMPLEIIYGNSTIMRQLVVTCLKRMGTSYNNGYKNQYGRLLIMAWKS